MSYSNPLLQGTYSYAAVDMGAGDSVARIQGPLGRRGRLKYIVADVTEAFTDDTTQGFVRVGTNADNDAYAELGMATAAINATWDSDRDDDDAIIDADIPEDTELEVNFVAPTGGTPAGIATFHIHIDWF